jgi:hypothetical protein
MTWRRHTAAPAPADAAFSCGNATTTTPPPTPQKEQKKRRKKTRELCWLEKEEKPKANLTW